MGEWDLPSVWRFARYGRQEVYMDNNMETAEKAKAVKQAILDSALRIIKDPAGFFRDMPKSGGFGDPLVFAVVMGVVAGLVRALLGLFHFGGIVSTGMAIAAVVLTPIMVIIFGFVGAAILFVIWKLMGSGESYETAYRCGAYASAITPITALVNAIPFVGMLVGLGWMLYLLVMASVEVHKIAAGTAWKVFGVIAAVLVLMGGCSEVAARKMRNHSEAWQRELGVKPGKDMTPEEAGKAAAVFMKAMQEAAAKEAAKQKEE